MRTTVVVGAGLAGLMGALALAEAGLRPLVLAKGQGATHWTSGCVDVWGEGDSPRDALAALPPEHPYAQIGLESIEEGLARFVAFTRAMHYPFSGSISRNLLLPTATGSLRPTCLVPPTMAAGDMRLPGSLLVVGFHELKDFYPPLIAANLRAQGYDATGVYLDFPPVERDRDFGVRNVALLFDRPEVRRAVAEQVRALRGDARRVAFPAVLGLHQAPAVVQDIQSLVGALVFEIPTLPPSVPGMRLFGLFRRAIEDLGGRIQIDAEVVRAEGTGDRLAFIWSEAAARQQKHRVEHLLLATGGIAGGGLSGARDGTLREVALGLPVQAPASRTDWFRPKFLAAEGQPIFQAGIATDASLHPLDAAGRVVYRNVRVAGTLLAGADPVRQRCYEGLAIATGWAAGRMLVQEVTAYPDNQPALAGN